MRIFRWCMLTAMLASAVAAGPAAATFPGENGRISIHRWVEEDEGFNVFTVTPRGSDLTRVTSFGTGVFSLYSDWSPDGERLAIETDRSGSQQIWIINPDGSGARQLTDSPNGAFDPAWTPDGRRLAVGADFGDGQGIFLIPARSRPGALVARAEARRVTLADGGYDTEAQVSPDGRWIVFTRYSVECTAEDEETFKRCTTRIFRVRTNGSRLQQITRPELNASAPDYHPSGRWIAFDTNDNFVAPNAGSIVVIHPDGSGERVILQGDDDDYFNNPSFSPDGRRVVFARWQADDPDAGSRIWVARADGRNPRQLLDSPTTDNKPDWGSDPDDHDHHGHEGRNER